MTLTVTEAGDETPTPAQWTRTKVAAGRKPGGND